MKHFQRFLRHLIRNSHACARCFSRIPKRVYFAFLFALVVISVTTFSLLSAPSEFPAHSIVTIESGSTLSDVAEVLEKDGIVRSSFWFVLYSRVFGGLHGVIAGDYFFGKKEMLPSVVFRLTNGKFGVEPVRVTIPEGAASYEIAQILDEKLVDFDKEEFLLLAKDREGFLFPDTYLFSPVASPKTVVAKMEDTFANRIMEIEPELSVSNITLTDALIMASILEKEARKFETRKMIAGILWKRFSIDMPLQVDAVFGYIKGTATFHPSFSDLEVDSPYNTYKHIGLPPGPIGNPGLSSIRAALDPTESPYLYYLTGEDGVMRYSKSFDEHVQNKQWYLN
jgi:UPF0755 protein